MTENQNFSIETSICFQADYRTEVIAGREFSVFPVVMLRELVMADYLMTYAEFSKMPQTWNFRPVTMQHPLKPDNKTLTLVNDDPRRFLETIICGHLDNTAPTMPGDDSHPALKSEAWMDVERTNELGFGTILQEMRENPAYKLDVSIGMTNYVKEKTGTFQGRKYKSIPTNFVPDHLALLPGINGQAKKGACDWARGCGVRLFEEPAEEPAETHSNPPSCGCDGSGGDCSCEVKTADNPVHINTTEIGDRPMNAMEKILSIFQAKKTLSEAEVNDVKSLLAEDDNTTGDSAMNKVDENTLSAQEREELNALRAKNTQFEAWEKSESEKITALQAKLVEASEFTAEEVKDITSVPVLEKMIAEYKKDDESDMEGDEKEKKMKKDEKKMKGKGKEDSKMQDSNKPAADFSGQGGGKANEGDDAAETVFQGGVDLLDPSTFNKEGK